MAVQRSEGVSRILRCMERRFSQVDVFGDDLCTGNPVAVILDGEGLDDESLRRFSVWSNLSECTFVLPPTVPG
ncbi:PhzF family phenazine biosynthesis protein, partial [Brevibacterium sp.]|uniref:PhzF family phenazine biosynthesis protein n=1 Tax=Brevibacterium sp. TaxID=1701 RepID=UPI00281274C6